MAIQWKVNIRRDNNNHNEITDAFVSSEEGSVCDCYMNESNAALIVDAVNNTAGSGIDPKSVPFMLQACKNALADLAGIMPEYEPDGDRNHSAWTTINELSQAITDAQIK